MREWSAALSTIIANARHAGAERLCVRFVDAGQGTAMLGIDHVKRTYDAWLAAAASEANGNCISEVEMQDDMRPMKMPPDEPDATRRMFPTPACVGVKEDTFYFDDAPCVCVMHECEKTTFTHTHYFEADDDESNDESDSDTD